MSPHAAFPLCTYFPAVSLFLEGYQVLLDRGSALRTSFNLNHFLKGHVSKYSHFQAVGLQLMSFGGGGDTIQSITVGDY